MAAGPTRWQRLAVIGVPTFLLLEGGATRDRVSSAPAPGDRELGARAEDFHAGLSLSERRVWPGGVARTLGGLADRSFFPTAGPPAESRASGGDLYRALAEGRYVRAVNFHATPKRLVAGFEEQISKLAESFAPVSYDDLEAFVTTGRWSHDRPGVVLNFFDGFRDNFEVAAPILDKLGMIGWFFLVSGWISSPPQDQRLFANRHLIDLPHDGRDLSPEGRISLSPGEVEDLARRGHVIASHTRGHTTASPAFAPDLSPEALAREVAGSRQTLEDLAGKPVRALAWREGTPLGADRRADEALAGAGYGLLFANHAVQRIP